MRELSDGNLEVVLPGIARSDEIGKVANAVVKFRDNVTEQQRLADEFARAVKEREALSASMETALTSFRTTSDEILAAVDLNARQMRDTAQGLTGVAQDASSQSTAASAASEDTSSKVRRSRPLPSSSPPRSRRSAAR